MRKYGLVAAALVGRVAAMIPSPQQVANKHEELRRLLVVVPTIVGDLKEVKASLGLRSSACSPVTQQYIALAFYYVHGREDEPDFDDDASAVEQIAAGCFAATLSVFPRYGAEDDIFGAGPPVIINKAFLKDKFHADLSEYGAVLAMGWEVLFGSDTSLDEVYRDVFRVENNIFGGKEAKGLLKRIRGPPLKAYEDVTCSRGEYPCSVGGRLLSQRSPPQYEVTPDEACSDFASGGIPESSWTLDECRGVWDDFALSVPKWMRRRFEYVDLWKDTALELRQSGSPCLVATTPLELGVGSETIRHLTSWIYAEQMGCNWATPIWGTGHQLGNGSVLYCHTVTNEHKPEEGRSMDRCSVANWLSYFQFDVPSVAMPQNVILKNVQPDYRSTEEISAVQSELQGNGSSNLPWDQVVFVIHPSHATNVLMNLGSWDESKRQVVRRVLHEARENFHRHPRPWYDEHPKCDFTEGRLHFAAHVRMGDRRANPFPNSQYFQLLENVMSTISDEVVDKGLSEPMFHVFSETEKPCPSGQPAVFDEFPTWSMSADEVLKCMAAPVADECPQLRASQNLYVPACSPTRDGVFHVVGKNIVLHVGEDVLNALSCMIQADGLLMGCSTFGQVAGILSKGISMFSKQCLGRQTPLQYGTTPPLAVAERGHLWVPIEGSWRNPVLSARSAFRRALDTLLS